MSSPPSPNSPAAPANPFAESTPLGLLGLAIGCAALIPIAFGQGRTPAGFQMAAFYCLYFGAGCQFIAGLMALANKNLLGGTLFTTFAFNWLINYQVFSGHPPDPHVGLSVDVVFLLIFSVLSYAFGFFSKLLFAFLLDIVVLFCCRILKELTHSAAFNLPIGLTTVVLALIALYLAFAILVNSAAGRPVFPMPGPLFTPTPPATTTAAP